MRSKLSARTEKLVKASWSFDTSWNEKKWGGKKFYQKFFRLPFLFFCFADTLRATSTTEYLTNLFASMPHSSVSKLMTVLPRARYRKSGPLFSWKTLAPLIAVITTASLSRANCNHRNPHQPRGPLLNRGALINQKGPHQEGNYQTKGPSTTRGAMINQGAFNNQGAFAI